MEAIDAKPNGEERSELTRTIQDFGFGLRSHRRVIESVPEKVFDDHDRVSVLEELRGFGERLPCGLHDDAEGAYAPPRVDMERHGLPPVIRLLRPSPANDGDAVIGRAAPVRFCRHPGLYLRLHCSSDGLLGQQHLV
jgi:hypothetical protein